MSDIVKVIFDGDLGPLQQKQALAKGELNAFVTESEAEIKGIASAGDAIGTSAQKGAESFSRYYKPVINDVSRDITALGAGFERVLGAEGSRAAKAGLEDLGYSLKKLNIDGYEAAASSQVLNTELRSINKQLAIYKLELAEASQANIFFAETEAAAAVAGKAEQGGLNLGARPLQGYGGLFRATGLTNAGVNETEANAALNIVSKLGISVSSLAVVGGVAALGAAAVLVSEKINSEADKRLASEEGIASAINKQVLGLKESLSDYAKIKDQLIQQEALQRKISTLVGQNDSPGVKALREKTDQENISKVTEINRLQADLAQQERALAFEKARQPSNALGQLLGGLTPSQQRQNVGQAENAVEQTKKKLSEAEDALRKGTQSLSTLDKAQNEIIANQDKRFSNNFENFQKAEKQKADFAEKQAEKFAQNVKQGQAEADKLVTGYKEEFDKLYADSARENPFATQIIQSSKALEVLETKLKGVGPELRKQATDLQAAASAQAAYTVQINSAFQTIDYRAQAAKFRNPTQKELQDQLDSRISEFQRTSNSTNPDVFYEFQREQQRINDTNRRQNQDIVDQKIDVASRAKSPAEQAIADKALTAFAGGLNPDDLTQSERAKIADAFERSAVRNEKRQEDALQIQKDLLKTMQNIDKRGATLNGIAGEGGKTKLDITLKDDTSDKKATAATATTDDVAKTYDLGFVGGTNK